VGTFLTRWGWLIILLVAVAVFFVEPTDKAMLASSVLLGAGFLAAGVSIALKRQTRGQNHS
jgi:hypothetical protein